MQKGFLHFLTVSLAAVSVVALPQQSSSTPHLFRRECTLNACLDAASLNSLTAEEEGYDFAAKPFNLRLNYKPIAIVIPETPEQVAAAVLCANEAEVKVTPRGGGHSYAGYSLGGQDGSLVVDLNHFNTIEVDQQTGIAAVGAGVRLGNLALHLFGQGGRALPHGTCPGVGIGGHALHGGYGYTSRMWGMTLDTIVELDVVLADGTITKASATQNPELFWALRGAGSSFGIVTKFYFETKTAPQTSIAYTLNLPQSMNSTVAGRVSAFQAMQQFGLNAQKEHVIRIYMDAGTFTMDGMHFGTINDLNQALQPLLALLPGATVRTTSMDWLETLEFLGSPHPVPQPLTGYDKHDTFFAKSLMTKDLLTDTQLTSFFDYASNQGGSTSVPWWVMSELYGGGNSEIASKPLSSASYANRETLFTFQLYTYTANSLPPYPEGGIDFLNAMVNSITSHMDPGQVKAYANYVDPTLSAAEAHQQYYGNEPWDGTPGSEGVYDRLVRIKQQVDPNKVIWNPQAIGVE